MRKLIATAFLLSALMNANAQFYGEVLYSHPTSSLSSGGVTNINSTGFLMASFAPTFTNASMIYNFVIDKTDDNGDFTGGADFSNGYSTSGATGCSGSVSATGNCAGVSVIEINPFTTNTGVDAWYALAGANSNGPFFALLDNVGAPLIAMDYNPNASMSSISKPLIVECTTTPNNFFVCGQINGQLYVIKIDGTGSQVWSKFYRTDPVMRPQAIIECPYTGDLVIVGLATFPVAYNRASDGFFLTIDPSNGNVNIFNTYGHPVNACNEFYSISIANSTTGGSDGFFIGGWSDPVAGNGNGWFLKLDPSGNIVWDKLIEPTSAIGPIVGVFERLNTSSNYEYYGVGITVNGYTVAKLDDGGTPFSGGNNEFWYDAPAINWSDPNSLSNIVSGGPSPNEGLQVYGTERLVTGGDSYMVSAYFNGVSGCEAGLTNLLNEEDGPDDIIQPQITPIQGLNDCGGFSLNYSPLGTTPNYICGPATSVGGGSNARNSQLKNGETSKAIISLYPNPSNGVFNLQVNNSIYNGEILIFNNLGQIVYNQKVEAGINSVKPAQLSSGVYHYTVSENGTLIHTGKLVIE